MKNVTTILTLLLFLLGCANDPVERTQQLGGLVTVSALVIALPLIPFVGTYTAIYDELNQTEKKLKEKREYWESVFDSVYAERIDIIESRTPEKDAELIFSSGTEIYFPSLSHDVTRFDLAVLYPGVEYIWKKEPDKRTNHERIRANELANYMWVLMSKDPAHVEAGKELYIAYCSETWTEFISARFDYIKRFNLRMHELSKSGSEGH